VRIDTLSLATGSTLRLSGADVTAAQVIVTADITKLVFTPAANASGTSYASFTFSVRDTNGPAYDPSSKTMTIDVTAVNDAPVAVDEEFNTQQDTARSFTQAQLKGNDTDADNTNEQLSVTAGATRRTGRRCGTATGR